MTDLHSILAPFREPIRLAIPAGFAAVAAISIRAWKLDNQKAGRIARAILQGLRILFLGSLIWFGFEATAGLANWQTPAPLALPAFLGALGIRLTLALRAVERPLSPWPARLRIGILAVMAALLAEPAHTWLQDLRPERKAVLLFDDSASMRVQARPDAATPLAAAVAAVSNAPPQQPSFLAKLGKTHDAVLRRFALESSDLSPADLAALPALGIDTNDTSRLASDLASALEATHRNAPKGWLKGVLLFSDGRHTAAGSVEEVARRLGAQGIPVFPVLPPEVAGRPDASILSVSHPDSIFESDRARFTVSLQAHAMKGRTLRVVLRQGERIAAEKQVPVPEDIHRAEVALVDLPTEKGILDYRLSVETDGEDFFPENNQRPLRMAVSDDRYQVLMVDSVPRWEFRYLRNLFHARDKSVQLQYVLLDPDTLEGHTRPDIEASPRRPFGESEATRLPAKIDDWKPFDVVVLGDIPPGALTAEQWKTLGEMTARQGTLLVVIAGPLHMPADYAGHPLAELLPFNLAEGQARPATENFRLTVSRAGLKHPVMRLDDDETKSANVWRDAPPSHWRIAGWPAKPGAEVLLFARPDLTDLTGGTAASVDSMLDRMRLRDQEEKTNALATWSGWGKGKVVMLNFDATWRLRYGVGDTHHHRFWGQLLRWGAGPRLRAGDDKIRLGTDKLVYAPGEAIQVLARASADDETLRKLGDLRVTLTPENGSSSVATLAKGEEYAGLFQQEVLAPAKGGLCRITLDVPEALRTADGPREISTEILVSQGQRWVEMTDLTVDRTRLAEIARLSGGELLQPDQLDRAIAALTKDNPPDREIRSRPVWNHPLVFCVLLGLLTGEWYLRRRASLP